MESDGLEPSTFILVSNKETCQWRDSVLIETSIMLYQSELRLHRSAPKLVIFWCDYETSRKISSKSHVSLSKLIFLTV